MTKGLESQLTPEGVLSRFSATGYKRFEREEKGGEGQGRARHGSDGSMGRIRNRQTDRQTDI